MQYAYIEPAGNGIGVRQYLILVDGPIGKAATVQSDFEIFYPKGLRLGRGKLNDVFWKRD